jgi:hypothetical protein
MVKGHSVAIQKSNSILREARSFKCCAASCQHARVQPGILVTTQSGNCLADGASAAVWLALPD